MPLCFPRLAVLRVVCAVALFMLSGCAAMFHGSKAKIVVKSKYSDTSIYLSVDKGTTRTLVGTGNAVITLPKNHLGKAYIILDRSGCKENTILIDSQIDGLFWVNFLSPFFVGFIVDAAMGSMRKPIQTLYDVDPVC